MNKLIKQYNKANNLLVISPYPKKGTVYNYTHGIVSFAKNTVKSLLPHFKKDKQKIVVITDRQSKKEVYVEDDVLVCRTFKKNSISMYLDIFKELFKFKNSKNILIQFDFSLYGDFLPVSLFGLFMMLLKFLGYSINLVLHSVVLDLKTISPHLGYKNDLVSKINIIVFNSGLKFFYYLFIKASKNIIVMESDFIERLKSIDKKAPVVYLPHGVDVININNINKEEARRKLKIKKNDFLVVSFGFVTWYKGADFLINNFTKPVKIANKSIKFLLSGGPAPSLIHKKYYQNYYKKLQARAIQSKNIKITGFIEEKNIPIYFKAADLIIFPYRTLMSSSGPLSFVYTFEKPFALSNCLKSVMKNDYFKKAILETKLVEEDLFFSLTKKDLINHIKKIIIQKKLEKLASFSKSAKKELSWKLIGKNWYEIVQTKTNEKVAFGFREASKKRLAFKRIPTFSV